jgi:hypothetical protein
VATAPRQVPSVAGSGNRQGSRARSEPVFVLTCPRSGSTLLRHFLDSHPRITCPPESQLVIICQNIMASWSNYRQETTSTERRASALKQARSLLRDFIKWHLENSGKEVFSDKSLPNIEHFELLAEAFPRARFICLFRNPMDVVASMLEACRWGSPNFPTVDHRNSPGIERSGGLDMSVACSPERGRLEGCRRSRTNCP